jgi:hypothetical protein
MDLIMYVFDHWLQETHPDILEEFSRRSKAEQLMPLWIWMYYRHTYVITREWPRAARRFSRSRVTSRV